MERNTPEADAAGMGYTDGACCGDKVEDRMRFLRERQGENKGDERGSARRGRRAGGRAHKRKKEMEREGVRYEGRGMRVESRPDAREKEKHTVHKDGEHCTMPRPRENGELRTRYRQRS